MDFKEALRVLESVHPENCPRCGNVDFIKYGKTKNKKQRYQCKKCFKTFSENTNAPFMYSKKSLETWIDFISCMVENLTLRSISNLLSINLSTAFFWRHKILSVVETNTDTTLTGNIEISELKLRESFKGSKVPEPDYYYYGNKHVEMGRNNIFILSCRDNENNIFMRAVAKMRPMMLRKEHLDNILGPLIKDGKSISTSRNINYRTFAKNNRLKLSINGSGYLIPDVDTVSARKQSWLFKRFLRSFRNVASKYISHYINLFRLMIDEDADPEEGIINRLANRKRKLRICDFSKVIYDGSMA